MPSLQLSLPSPQTWMLSGSHLKCMLVNTKYISFSPICYLLHIAMCQLIVPPHLLLITGLICVLFFVKLSSYCINWKRDSPLKPTKQISPLLDLHHAPPPLANSPGTVGSNRCKEGGQRSYFHKVDIFLSTRLEPFFSFFDPLFDRPHRQSQSIKYSSDTCLDTDSGVASD